MGVGNISHKGSVVVVTRIVFHGNLESMHYEKCNLKNRDNFVDESYQGNEWQGAMDGVYIMVYPSA